MRLGGTDSLDDMRSDNHKSPCFESVFSFRPRWSKPLSGDFTSAATASLWDSQVNHEGAICIVSFQRLNSKVPGTALE
jgi:hypothetical protein